MYAATTGPKVKWGVEISNGGGGHHCPPEGGSGHPVFAARRNIEPARTPAA